MNIQIFKKPKYNLSKFTYDKANINIDLYDHIMKYIEKVKFPKTMILNQISFKLDKIKKDIELSHIAIESKKEKISKIRQRVEKLDLECDEYIKNLKNF